MGYAYRVGLSSVQFLHKRLLITLIPTKFLVLIKLRSTFYEERRAYGNVMLLPLIKGNV